MRSCRSPLLLVCSLLAGCHAAEPGAAVYFRTVRLTEVRVDALERALGRRPDIAQVATVGPGPGAGPWRGTVALERGRDGPAARARLLAWLRARPEIAAAGEDSIATFR